MLIATHGNERIVGIDLGTTNSLVAYMEGDRPVVIPGEDGLNLVPSVVALDENGQIVVGSAARKYLIETPERAVYSVKRLMGRDVEDVRDELKLFPFRLADDLAAGEVLRIKLGDKTFTPPEISAFILRQLKRNAERYFAAPVTKAVITVPAYFNDAQRQATKDAGRIAGLEVLRLVNEPTAASLAYGLDKKNAETVAVYDLGGGTFDISILKLHEGIFEVIATNGDTHLGGDDIDNLLITIALHDIQGDLAIDVRRNAEIVQAIRKAVIDAKIALSSDEKTTLDVELPGGKRYQREITRAQFEQLIQPVIDRTVGPVRQAMKDAGLTAKQINEAVLVGGSTRIPRVRQLVEELFQRTPHSGLESRRSGCAGRGHTGSHPGGWLGSDQGNAAARRDAAVARHRIAGRRRGQDHSSQLDDSGVGDRALHHRRGRPDQRCRPRCARRARTGERLPLPGALRPERHSAHAGGTAAHRSEIPDRRQRHSACLGARAAQRQGS